MLWKQHLAWRPAGRSRVLPVHRLALGQSSPLMSSILCLEESPGDL